MKNILFAGVLAAAFLGSQAQDYPIPEFSNEVYFLKKDSGYQLQRLEKESSSLETRVKAAGFGGTENGYSVEGARSKSRLPGGKTLSFVFLSGAKGGIMGHSESADSMMQSNGIDPSLLQGIGTLNDPSATITLYKMESGGGIRKIILQKSGGAFGSHKSKSSEKITFSTKSIGEGYWELIPDKPLDPGEYAFTMMSYSGGNSGAGATIYAFGID